MPLHRRLPKRGFNNIFARNFKVVNIGSLQGAIDAGRLDASKPVDAAALQAAGLVKSAPDGIRLLATGQLKAKITITHSVAPQAAFEAGVQVRCSAALAGHTSP